MKSTTSLFLAAIASLGMSVVAAQSYAPPPAQKPDDETLRKIKAKTEELGQAITDDAQLVEAIGKPVYAVEGTADNIKITTKNDLALAGAILKARPEPKAARPIHPFADEEMWK